MPKISTEMDTYFRCISLTLLFLAQILSRGFGHSNQKHNFGPVKPNSHNKCKILHHSENRIAEELYYPKKYMFTGYLRFRRLPISAGILFSDTPCSIESDRDVLRRNLVFHPFLRRFWRH